MDNAVCIVTATPTKWHVDRWLLLFCAYRLLLGSVSKERSQLDGNVSRQRQDFATFGSRTLSCRRGYLLNKTRFTIEEIAPNSGGTRPKAFASMTRGAPITLPGIPMKRVYINSTARETEALIFIAYLTLCNKSPRAISSISLKRHRDSSCFGMHRESPPAILTRRPPDGAGARRGELPCFRNPGIQTPRG